MKKNYTVLLIALLLCGGLLAQEAQKNFINYQGVARDANNELMANESMTLGLAIRFGSRSSTIAYEEAHDLNTDANGVFSLKIGNGNATSGNYDNLPWGSGAAFVTVSINGSEIGTTELLAVPYAISSGDADDQSAAEVAYDNSVSNLSATNTQAAIDELVGSGNVDADPDPTNELQTISFDTGTNELSLTDGGTVTIPSGGTDADADPTNEFQNLSFDTNTNELSLSDGNAVTIPSGGTDADADPTNELQDISLSGTNLSISDGSTIDLAPIVPPGGTDDQNLEINGDVLSIENGNGTVDLNTYRDDNDADPTNEHQTLSFDTNTSELSLSDGNTVTLPNGGSGGTDDQNLEINGDVLSIENGNGSVDLGTYRDDNDADPTNEHQALSFDSNTSELSLTDGGTVTLPNGGGASHIDELVDGKTDGSSLFLGLDAGTYDNGDNRNVGVGEEALFSNSTGRNNTASGYHALSANTVGNENTANGTYALLDNTTGNLNTANGAAALRSNTTGRNNTANGSEALFNNTIGHFNTASGVNALYSNTTGNENTATGHQALRSNSTGRNNTASGVNALSANTTGNENTANGSYALLDNTTGNLNTANGSYALRDNTIGRNNTANGTYALLFNTEGLGNTANGFFALRNNTTGSNNTAIGRSALSQNTSANNNIAIGFDAQVDVPGWSNQVRIGNDQIFYAGIQVAWTVTSDRRWKEKIRELPHGLDMVTRLRPVDYVRKNNERKKREVGFIAQEVEQVMTELGYKDQGFLTKNDKGYMSLRYNDFIPVLTKAIQEQQQTISEQNEKISQLEKRLLKLETQLNSANSVQKDDDQEKPFKVIKK